ncbi:extracellular solute-binding protein [Paenibacillus sp. MER TA 81-3]|uniref:ABC transporter substrate-binding protein n=1 Tax=Paenibacillus sp. MER TA 81-3 TaxID=2939573 RepID=UPI002040CAA8|nr:extracellular solute-binding protein [Paenibacillus sp. MER TA 81-3]MCM3338811.1 extracellular solute-binding protein [Paenibacillus sp. MER TA 81-3]
MQKIIKTILVSAFIVLLTACQTVKQEIDNPQLRVLYWDEESFFKKHGNLFLANHPDYNIEVIPLKDELNPGKAPVDSMMKVIRDKQPDLIQPDLDTYKVLVKEGMLEPIDDLIRKDGYSLDDYVPAVLAALKDKESGELFGLPSTFSGIGLYYNKSIFQLHGIPLPKNHMNWDEIFQMAERFARPSSNVNEEQPQFGLYHKYSMSPFMMALDIGEGGGLSIYDPVSEQFTLHTDAWHKVIEKTMTCIKSGACYQAGVQKEPDRMDKNGILKRNYPFLNGNVAMAVERSDLLRTLIANKEPFDEFEWGVVSMPVHPDNPSMGNGISMNEIFSIRENSANKKAAWEFIKTISSESYGKLMMRSNTEELPARKSLSEKLEHPDIGAFYELEQTNNNIVEYLRFLPPPVLEQFKARANI